MKREKVRYYKSYEDDFVETKKQSYKVPENYKWIREDAGSKIISGVLYALAIIISGVYCRLFLHVKFKNRRILQQAKQTGAFVYCNHTQPVGDVFTPALACFPGRIYTIVSPANLGIPFVGKLLPYLGALPVPESFGGMKKFNEAVKYRVDGKSYIVIYPEAHVWEYYTEIRPFPSTSFKYPAKTNRPVYCMTTTYQKGRIFKKPVVTIYVDGPFFRDESVGIREQSLKLRNAVYECMKKRSGNSDYSYIRYEEFK